MARSQPVIGKDEYLRKVTREEELTEHREQLETMEHGHRGRPAPGHPGRGRGDVVLAPPRRPAMVTMPTAEGHLSGAERAETGVAGPALPAGIDHVSPAPTRPHKIAVPVPAPYYSGDMAHGVPGAYHPHRGRPAPRHDDRGEFETEAAHPEPLPRVDDPVPVYVVDRGAGPRPVRRTSVRAITLPVAGSDPVRLTALDLKRDRVALLNETSGHVGRFSTSPADLAAGKGAALPAAMGSYLWLHTQDDLYGVSGDSTAVTLSVIQEYEVTGGG